MDVVPRLWDQAMPPTMGMSHLGVAEIARNVGYLEAKHHGKKGEILTQNVLCLKKIDTSCN